MTDPTAREMIPALLDQHRPDRYDPEDHSWQQPVIERVAFDITAAEARQMAAAKLVSNAEATATKRTNRLLRDITSAGTFPLGWFDALAWPLAVDDHERVALRAAIANDFVRFANRERRAAANDFSARNDTCEGAQFVADYMAEHGIEFASDISTDEAA